MVLYMHVVGAERLGAALDSVLGGYSDNTVLPPSVLRRQLLEVATRLRGQDRTPFAVTAACLLVVGGNADNLELRNLATAVVTPPTRPDWISHLTFRMVLARDGTLVLLAELELLWTPRFLPSQRTDGSSFCMYETLLVATLPAAEATIIDGLAAAGKAEQYATITTTLLPTAPELLAYAPSSAAAALALSRSFTRASSAGGALTVGVHDVLTALPHYEPFGLAIGCEVGAPAGLGLAQEAIL